MEGYREILKRLLRIYSPSGDEDRAVREFVEIARAMGLEGYIDEDGNGVAVWGRGDRVVALIGHIDTVPGYIEVSESSEGIRGRGAVDAKGPLAAMLAALNELRISGEVPEDIARIYVIASVGEESDSRGALGLIRRGFKADAVIVGEPTNNNKIAIGYRGSMKVKVECSSVGGHASVPWIYISACEKLISLWENISRRYSGSSASSISASLTMMMCGEYHNVIPREGYAVIDIRYPPRGQSWREIMASIEEILPSGCRASLLKNPIEPVEVRPTIPIVRSLIRAVSRAGMRPEVVMKTGTSDMNLLYGSVSNNIAAYGPGRSELSHTDNEEILYWEFEKGIMVYSEAIKIFLGDLGVASKRSTSP
ncbi:MAG: M20/M25/M40 family metallo-hydrolase [Sulfolobales archaeon]